MKAQSLYLYCLFAVIIKTHILLSCMQTISLFSDRYSDAESRLQSDLLEKQLLKELVPGEVRMDTLTLPIETKYIGLMAEFVRYEGAKSLLVLPVRSHNKNSYSVELHGNNMAVSKEERVQSKKVKERKKSDPQESNNSRQVYSR